MNTARRLAFLIAIGCSPVLAEERVLVAFDHPVEVTVEVEGKRHTLQGRASGHLEAATAELDEGRVRARAFNLVFFDVPESLSGVARDHDEKGPALGFALASN